MSIIKPTCEELYEYNGAVFELVKRETDDAWRHGSYVTEVFRRIEDDTYWQADYRLSSDRETNELREGYAEICRVYPEERTITVYVQAKVGE